MKIIVFVLCFGLIAFANANISFDLATLKWQEFKLTHSKEYESVDEDYQRMMIFMGHAKLIAEHNQLYEQGEVSYKMAINEFSDLTNDEFLTQMTGLRNSSIFDIPYEYMEPIYLPEPAIEAEEVDWRKKGAVTEVKNQGHCGSCWAFSAVGAIEGQHAIHNHKLVSLSEQNLVDCSSNSQYGNHGCKGGSTYKAFKYVKGNGGIDSEQSYPYRRIQGKCRYNPHNSAARILGFKLVESGNEGQLTRAIATVGPISISIDARGGFRHYHSGIYYNPNCSAIHLHHAILAVGYGSINGEDYYIVKNSWGTTWGNSGFGLMARNRNNHCGIATRPSYPVV